MKSISTFNFVDNNSQSEEDVVKHEKELQKELQNRVINWKEVQELLYLTFDSRREEIAEITGLHAVDSMLKKFRILFTVGNGYVKCYVDRDVGRQRSTWRSIWRSTVGRQSVDSRSIMRSMVDR